MLGVGADRVGIAPATFAFFAARFSYGYADRHIAVEIAAVAVGNFNRGNDKNFGKHAFVFFKEIKGFAVSEKLNLGIERGADNLLVTGVFNRLFNVVTKSMELFPFSGKAVVNVNAGKRRIIVKNNVFGVAACVMGHKLPNFVGGKAYNRGKQKGKRVEDFINCGLGGAAGFAVRFFDIKSVL